MICMDDMNLEKLLKELKQEKIDADRITLTKNGVICKGIRISLGGGTGVSPIVYYSQSDTLEELYARVHRAIEMSDSSEMKNLVKLLRDWDYVKQHVVLSICRDDAVDSSWVCRDYLNLSVSMRVLLDTDNFESAGIYVTRSYAEEMGFSVGDLWGAARENSRSGYRVEPLSEVLGVDSDEPDLLYVVAGRENGATALLYKEVFRSFCEQHGERWCYILPSSTEEVLIVPGQEADALLSVKEMAQMVRTINEEQVAPEIRLAPSVYRYDRELDEISIEYSIEEADRDE